MPSKATRRVKGIKRKQQQKERLKDIHTNQIKQREFDRIKTRMVRSYKQLRGKHV